MELQTVELTNADGMKIYVRDYRPPSADSAPTLYCIHGLGEHGGRYGHLADWMVQRGWRMIFGDLRGHGRSSGTRTHVESFDQYVTDIKFIWENYDLDPSRTALFGHSMGGLVAVRVVESQAVSPAALILASPLLGLKLHVNPLKLLLGQALVHLFPKSRFPIGLDPENMTRDSIFSEERRQDPDIITSVTAKWFFAMRLALEAALSDAHKVTLPIFAVCGLADQTTDGKALSQWLAKTKSSNCELVSLPAHLHEIFHEADWQETAARMSGWLDRLKLTNESKIRYNG